MTEETNTTAQNEENKEISTVSDKPIEKKAPVRRATTTRKTPIKKTLIKTQTEPIVATNELELNTIEGVSPIEEAAISSQEIDSEEVTLDSFIIEKAIIVDIKKPDINNFIEDVINSNKKV